ncbi:ATP-binding cassette subfamily C protein LapB [Actimicrobium sp. GrIS 1.19]|uniref:type I secretion system permease/ATPase n=1 Tax=Actimicrobium sp. GrIS 1.19 TaxID=3071708 RepID=UPI002E063644|nr:ATP-binding cassette subfamily C protein LapB [Actimicrobium sp. GrIS 1.19]
MPASERPVDSPDAWTLPRDAMHADDPLAQCLITLTRLRNEPHSLQALTAGLPLEDGRLTPELFIRAAARANLSARIVKRPLARISQLTLPAVLLLQDAQACILTHRNSDGTLRIIQPESGDGELDMTLAALQECYSGYALFVRPVFRFDGRADSIESRVSGHWFWSTLRQSWPIYAEVLIASFLINVFALVMPLFTMNVYDRVVPNQTFETLWVLSLGVAVVFIFDFAMRSLRGYFLDVAGKKIDLTLSAAIYEKILAIRLASRPKSVGGFANTLTEFESFREFLTSATITTVIDMPFTVLYLLIIWWVGGWLVLVPLVAIPLILIPSILLQGPLARVINQTFRVGAQRQATLIETLSGLDTIKAISAEGPAQRRWEQLIGQIGKLSLRARLLSAASINAGVLVQQLANVALIIVGVYLIADKALSMGALIACTMLAGRTLAPLSQVAALATRFHHARSALMGLDRIMNLPVEHPPGKSFVHRPDFQGGVEFQNVSFAYPESPVEALSKASFKIAPGERVGIIGRIGSGKSTIEKLILGLYQPGEGSIWIDGIDQQQLDPVDLRRNIAYVPQDPVLFFGSVKDNIVMGAPYVDDAAMLRAADIAGVTDFVNRHPQGFDRAVGERGDGLSGGQRQSVAIARALLLDPNVLVLDEPTNSLDNRSEDNFKTRLLPQLANKTLILITHRASMLTLVNRLLVVEGGRIIADGPKEQVLEALSGGKLHAAKV